jgi:hypothetical protein
MIMWMKRFGWLDISKYTVWWRFIIQIDDFCLFMHIVSGQLICTRCIVIDITSGSSTIFNKQYYHWAIQAMNPHPCTYTSG